MKLTKDLMVGDHEIQERFVRAVGPGGQNPRHRATAVELRFDVNRSSLPADVRARLLAAGGRRVTADGMLVVTSRRYRSQLRNREAARAELRQLVREASEPRSKFGPA
jgi:ribosome-associated protein